MKGNRNTFALLFLPLLLLMGGPRQLIQSVATPVKHPVPAEAVRQLPPIGEFVAFCPFSHRRADDPIVLPGHAGHSHSHDFLGNVVTDADTTVEDLLAGDTTCDPIGDRSSYWVPTLYAADDAIVPIAHATFYYLVHVADPTTVQPYPLGLKVIAGDARATTPPDPAIFKWSCLGAPDSSTSEIVTCPVGSQLELLVNFPDCWNGQDLDSADHKSHMAYSAAGACPASHPVVVPALQFKLRYATSGEAGMRLASGPGYTAHADFFNAWESAALANRIRCLHELVKCGPEGYPEEAGASSVLYLPWIGK